MKYKILTFICFCFFYCNTYAQIGAVWNTTASGTLDGVPFTVTGFSNSFLASRDFSGSDYSTAPLSDNQQVIIYANRSDWTVTFDSPIKNLKLYIRSWRNGNGGNSSGTLSINGTKLSGSKFTVTGTEIDVNSNFADGIVEFEGDITSLSYNVDGGSTSRIVLTFGVVNPSVPTLSEWSLLILALLLMICGTLVLIEKRIGLLLLFCSLFTFAQPVSFTISGTLASIDGDYTRSATDVDGCPCYEKGNNTAIYYAVPPSDWAHSSGPCTAINPNRPVYEYTDCDITTATSSFFDPVTTLSNVQYASIPTLSEWGLLNLALLLMICGTLYLLQPNLRRI